MTTETRLQNLLENGFIPYRKLWNKEKQCFDLIPNGAVNTIYLRANFNTQIPGGIGMFLIKGDIAYYFGLDEKDQSPILELEGIEKKPKITTYISIAQYNEAIKKTKIIYGSF